MRQKLKPSLLLSNFLLPIFLWGCRSEPVKPRGMVPAGKEPPQAQQKERVTGIGGVFFKARDPKGMAAWYAEHLGIQSNHGYADFAWRDKDHPDQMGRTVWAIFPTNTTYLGQSSSSLMINYRVNNLERMLDQLRRDGVKIEKVENFDYGRFAWITDPEGHRIELWEPKEK